MSKRTTLAEQPTQMYRPRRAYHPAPPPPDNYVPVAQRAAAPRRRWFWVSLLLLVALSFLGLAVVAGAGYLVYRSPKILPGVHTLGVDLGGYNEETAATMLNTNWQAHTVVLDGGDGARTTIPATTLGLILDAPATARRAHSHGRDLRALPEALQYRDSEHGFPPVWYFNPEVARTALENVAPQLAVQPVDAGIALENGHVVATPAV
ncbi:MAG: hypothetical protein RRC07_01065, partial [Anaerolineae bacterium]|nr:hypothetical protein [Anaerolineae bacterium]